MVVDASDNGVEDNASEYEDPLLYDTENKSFEPDGPFYLALAQRIGSSVLEIGCGTGRITIPLAQKGIEITGLDIALPMLERAKTKSAGLPVRWVHADARSFYLDSQFRFIFESGAAFQHQLQRHDQEAMLARVRDHLEPEGRFTVGVMFPHPDQLVTDATEREWFAYSHEHGYEVCVSGAQHYDPIRQIKTETAYRRWTDADGRAVVKPAPLKLRYVFPQEMETLLHYNGFVVEERYGAPDFSPLTGESTSMYYLCRKRG